MAFAAVPVTIQAAVDAVDPNGRINDNRLSDRYFRFHDETFQRAVDYWTPKPGEVGAAGQITGQVLGGVLQFLASPAAAVATAHLSTSEDLVRQGVDPDAAILAGDVAAISTALGIAAPAAIGKTLAAKMASGAAINVGLNIPEAAIKREIVRSSGSQAGEQFDPFDLKARAVDVLLGAAFGAKAHWDARLTQADRDAFTVRAQGLHLEESSSPGRPTPQSVAAVREAMDQMLRGEPVQVERFLEGMESIDSPAKAAARQEISDVVMKELPETRPPIETPRMVDYEMPKEVEGQSKAELQTPEQARVQAIAERYPDLRIADVDSDGNVKPMTATEYFAKVEKEAMSMETNGASLLRAAASCLLGAV